MPIKRNFTKASIDRYITSKVEAWERAIILNLEYLGEECVNKARTDGSYTDQTGNLRSSIGYCIVKNGQIIKSVFDGSFGEGGEEGRRKSREILMNAISRYSSGIALIVVAGMDYAAKVEANGKNVLSTAEHYAEREAPKLMRQLKAKRPA